MKTNSVGTQLVIGLIILCLGASVVSSQSTDNNTGINGTGAAGANDLAILRIPSPHMGVLAPWPVEVIVCNLGTSPENLIPVQVTIERYDNSSHIWILEYQQTTTVSPLNPQDPVTMSFPTWTPADYGITHNTVIKYQITAEIQASDPRPINNLKYEIFNLGDGTTLKVTVPKQSNTASQFQFTITNTDGFACSPDYEVDVISLYPKTSPPLLCDQVIGAVTVHSGSTVTVTVPIPPVTGSFSFFRIKITIADTKAAACGLALSSGTVKAWPS